MKHKDKYVGSIINGEHHVVIDNGNITMNLPHLVRHSPDGFCWGYNGSGPADLALAILCHALGYTPAPVVYQRFKDQAIATLDMNAPFVLRNVDVLQHVDNIQAKLNITCLRCADRGMLGLNYCQCELGQRWKREDSMTFDEVVKAKTNENL